MKFKTIKDLSTSYYPSKTDMERQALTDFIGDVCDFNRPVDISNALLRAGIDSIEKLHRASIEELRSVRHIGDKKLEVIIKVKELITNMIEEES